MDEFQDFEFNQGFCCVQNKNIHLGDRVKPKKAVFCPFFLDLIQEHTRGRLFNMVLVMLLCLLAIHLTFYLFSPYGLGNQTTTQEDALAFSQNYTVAYSIATELGAWAQYLAIAIAVTVVSVPIFLATTISQNPIMVLPATVFILAVIAALLFLSLSTLIKAWRDDHYPVFLIVMMFTELGIITISFCVVVWSMWSFLFADPDYDWYNLRRKKEDKHVKLLLTPLEDLKELPFIVDAYHSLQTKQKYLPGFLLTMLFPETIYDVDPQLFFRQHSDIFVPSRIIFGIVGGLFVLILGAMYGVAMISPLYDFFLNVVSFSYLLNYFSAAVDIVKSGSSFRLTTEQLNNLTKEINETITSQSAQDLAQRVALGTAIPASFVALTVGLINSVFLYFNFKDHVYKLRQGNYKRNFFNIYPLKYATEYFGLQIMSTLISFVLWYLVILLVNIAVVFYFYNDAFKTWVLTLALPCGIAFVIITLPGMIVYATVMTTEGGRVIRSRSCWVSMDYFNLILQLIRAPLNFFMRAFYWITFFVIYVMRLDQTILPKGWRSFDEAHASYMSTAMLDHIFNNPVGSAFREVLLKTAKRLSNKKRERSKLKLKFYFLLTCLMIQNPSLYYHRYTTALTWEKRKEKVLNKIIDEIRLEEAEEHSSSSEQIEIELKERKTFQLPSKLEDMKYQPDVLITEQINEFREAFYLLHRTQHQILTPEHVIKQCLQLGLKVTPDRILLVFHLFSGGKRDFIDLPEFMTIVASNFVSKELVEMYFDVLSEGNPVINVHDLKKHMKKFCLLDLKDSLLKKNHFHTNVITKNHFVHFMLTEVHVVERREARINYLPSAVNPLNTEQGIGRIGAEGAAFVGQGMDIVGAGGRDIGQGIERMGAGGMAFVGAGIDRIGAEGRGLGEGIGHGIDRIGAEGRDLGEGIERVGAGGRDLVGQGIDHLTTAVQLSGKNKELAKEKAKENETRRHERRLKKKRPTETTATPSTDIIEKSSSSFTSSESEEGDDQESDPRDVQNRT